MTRSQPGKRQFRFRFVVVDDVVVDCGFVGGGGGGGGGGGIAAVIFVIIVVVVVLVLS